jgi:hypothetical protein
MGETVMSVLLYFEAQVADALLAILEGFEAVDVVLLRRAVEVDAVGLLIGSAGCHALAVHADLLHRVPQTRVLQALQLTVHFVAAVATVLVLLCAHRCNN